MIERNLKYGLYYNAIANCKRKNDGVTNAAERGMIIVIFIMCLFWGCSSKDVKQGVTNNQMDEQKDESAEYVIIETLSSKDYASYDGINLKDGFVSTPEIAVQIAEVILKKIYGEKRIESQKPFSINLENGIWIVEGYWDRNDFSTDGGVAYIEIRKDNGEILKVIHGK